MGRQFRKEGHRGGWHGPATAHQVTRIRGPSNKVLVEDTAQWALIEMTSDGDDLHVFFLTCHSRFPLYLICQTKTISFSFLTIHESLLFSVLLTFAADLGLSSLLTTCRNIQQPLNSSFHLAPVVRAVKTFADAVLFAERYLSYCTVHSLKITILKYLFQYTPPNPLIGRRVDS